jgi:hypothetical protein
MGEKYEVLLSFLFSFFKYAEINPSIASSNKLNACQENKKCIKRIFFYVFFSP